MFVLLGYYLYRVFSGYGGANTYDSIKDIYGLMWLDVWNLCFILTLGTCIFFLPWGELYRRNILLLLVGIFGAVALKVIFDQTKFPDNGYWGDQKFHIAAVLKYMTTSWTGDYYYKNLPVFYPPLYEYILALVGKLIGIEPHALLSIGYRLVALFSPILLYALWSRIVSANRAVAIALCSMIVDIGGAYMQVQVPYAFLSNALFIPWWLGYVEGVGKSANAKARSRWVLGSLIGAALFALYFYPFFMLPFLMLAKRATDAWSRKSSSSFFLTLRWPIAILIGSALFSAPYWLPVLISIVHFGGDRSRGDWFHSGTPGLHYPFGDFNWVSVVFLVCLVIILFRFSKHTHRALASVLIGEAAFLILANVLGAFDAPFNMTKAREFLWSVGGPIVGMAVIDIYCRSKRHAYLRPVLIGSSAMVLLFFLGGTSQYARSDSVHTAKVCNTPNFGLLSEERANMVGKVVLTSEEELFAFVPAYGFMCVNEHYSHPASRFAQRYDFLRALQFAGSAQLVRLALSANDFDSVNMIMPEFEGDSLLLRVSLSAYPNRLAALEIKYPTSWFTDSRFFSEFRSQRRLFRVGLSASDTNGSMIITEPVNREQVLSIDNVQRISNYFSNEGRRQLNVMTRQTLPTYAHPMVRRATPISRRFVITSASYYSFGDSIALSVTYRVNRAFPPGSRARLIWKLPQQTQEATEQAISKLETGVVDRVLFVTSKGTLALPSASELLLEVNDEKEGSIGL